jgi:hypothetical protein
VNALLSKGLIQRLRYAVSSVLGSYLLFKKTSSEFLFNVVK